MTENFKNLDTLINTHTDQQLSMVDWDQLYGRIQKKLDIAEKQKPIASKRGNLFRIAAGISAAAAILLVVLMLTHESEKPLSLPPGQRAAVRLTEQESIVKAEIKMPSVSVSINFPGSLTEVQTSSPDVQLAYCEVSIIDQNGQTEKEDALRPSWIIMMASKPDASQSQKDKDQLDIAYML